MSSCDNSNIKKNYIVTSTEIDILSACTGFYTNDIYPCTGDTIIVHSDILSANTINSSVILSGGTNLLDIFGSNTNTFINGFTYDNSNNLTITRNDAISFDVNITEFSGITVNGVLSACTGIYTTNLYGCSPITVQDDLILLSGLTLSAITNDDSLSEILVRDSVTGLVKYRDVSSITPDTNTFVTGVTYTKDYAVLTRNDNVDVLKLSGGTNVVFNNPSPNEIVIDVTIPPDTNTFVTGFTYDDSNNLTISRNDDVDFGVNIDTMSGLTINGDLLVTGTTNISGLTSINSSLDVYNGTIGLRDNDYFLQGTSTGGTNVQLIGVYSNNEILIGNQGYTNRIMDDTIIKGGLDVLSGLTLSQTPTLNNSGTDILIRNNVTGEVEYRPVSGITPDTNTFVTGFTYDNVNTFTISRNDNVDLTSTISILSGITYYGDGSNLSGITTTDTFVTGQTFDNSTYILSTTRNDGVTLNTNLSILASDVYVLSGVYNPSTGIVTYTNSTGGTFEVSGFTTGMTDSYTNDAYLNGTEIRFDNNIQGVNFYNVDLLPLLSGKTDNSTFNSYTSNTETILNSKVSGATNLSTTGLFAQKNGDNLEFKGLTSTGGTVEITNDSTTVNLEVVGGTDTFSTGGTVTQSATSGSSDVIVQIVGNDGFTPYNITGLTDTFINDFSISSNTFTISQNDGSSFVATADTIDLASVLSAVTFDIGTSGSISATTFNGGTFNGTFVGDGSGLTGITDNNTFVTGGTYNESTDTITLTRNDAVTIDITGVTDTFTTGATYDNGTALATFTKNDGSTYTLDLSTIDVNDTFVTGFTYNDNNTFTITRNDGVDITSSINTVSALTVTNYIDYTTGTKPSSISGRTYFDRDENALSYFPDTPANDVTINIGQESVIRVHNNTGVQINNGEVCHISSDLPSVNGVPSVVLAIATGSTTTGSRYLVSGVATHDIPNGTEGFITEFGLVRDLNITGVTEGTEIYLSETTPGAFRYSAPDIEFRRSVVGYVVTTGTTTGKILVQITNEVGFSELSESLLSVVTENNSSTGTRDGGEITINTGDNTLFDISSGSGIIVDNYTDPNDPTITNVVWDNITGNTVTNLTADTASFIFLNSSLNTVQFGISNPPTEADYRDNIFLGIVGHANFTNLINVFSTPIQIVSPINQLQDLTSSIGPFSISGNRVENITNTLKLQKSVGKSYFYGGNFHTDNKVPSSITTSQLSGSTLIYAKSTAVLGPTSSDIDPNNYDLNGTITPVGGSGNYVAHRIWHQPSQNLLIFQYGQAFYTNAATARDEFEFENFVVPPGLNEVAYLVAVVIAQDGSSDLNSATIIPQGKFAGTGGGGGSAADTLQTAYNNSSSPEIVTDATRGAVDFRVGSGSDSDNVVTFQQNSGTINAFVEGTGNAKFETLSGDSLNILSLPTLNNSATDILVRNSSTGVVEYRPVSGITPDTNTFVTGGTYSDVTDTITLTRNDAVTIDITGVTDTFTTGSTYDNGTALATFNRNDGGSYTLDLSTIDVNDTFITGFTYNDANTFTLNRNDGVDISTSINIVTGLTVNGDIEMGNSSTRQIYSTGVSEISSIQYATSGTSVQMRWDGGGDSTVFNVNNTDFTSISSTKSGFGGIVYGADYSANYDDRSLIDLGYFNSNNRYVTGGTYDNSTALISYSGANGFPSFTVDLSSIDVNDTFVTGSTVSANTLTLTRNDLQDVLLLSGGSNVQFIDNGNNSITLNATTSGGGASVSFPWKFKNPTTSGDPGSGQFRFNDTVASAITEIYVNDFTNNGIDASNLLNILDVGDVIYIQQNDDASRAVLFTVSASTVDNTGWFTIPVQYQQGSTIPKKDKICGWIFASTGAEDNTVSNVGVGQGVFKQRNVNDFEFYSLSGGNNTTLTLNNDTIVIDVAIPPSMNTYVTGGTYNDVTDTITLTRNDAVTVDITGITDTFTTGSTYDNGTATATFTRNDGNTYTLDLSTIDVNDTFVTGFTYNDANTLTITRNDGVDITTSFNIVTGLTVNGDLTVTGETSLQSTTASTITLSSTPTENNTNTEILSRNSSTGVVEYRDIATFGVNITTVTATTYTATTTDDVIGFDTTSVSPTLFLPDSTTIGRIRYEVKDIGFNSRRNPITIQAAGSDLILTTQSTKSFDLSADGGAVILVSTGAGQWWQM